MANVFDQFDAPAGGKKANPFDQFDAPAQPITKGEKFEKGLRDPIDAGAQLLTKVLPSGVVEAGNQFNNWIADKTGLVGRLPEGGVDQQVREGEQAYQQRRQATGESGFDGYRVLGNVLNPANLAAGARLPQAASLAGRMAVGAGFGAATGAAFTPVTQGDFAEEKTKQALGGAVFGAATPVAATWMSRLISPEASKNKLYQLLRQEGVHPTVGQTLGGRWNALEEKMQSIPIMGDAIANARGRALEEFNNAAINRASGQVGVRTAGAGHEAVGKAGDSISQAYDDALSQVKHVQLDPQFSSDLTQLHGLAQNLVPAMRDKFNRTLNDVVMGRVSKQGSILGETYKSIDSDLGSLVSKYGKSSAASEQELGDALKQLQSLLRQQMVRSNPQAADALRSADAGWANLVRIEGAAKSAKNAEGVFTPAQLNGAIQAADSSTRKRAVSRGTALLQDLGNAGQTVLGNKVPNSFTADRALIAGGALTSYLLNPAIPGGLVGGAAMYSRPAQNMLASLLTARPQAAQPVANALDKYSAALLPLSTQIGLGLVNQ